MERYVNTYKFHYLYKITNLVNLKYYYGIHSTNNIEDGYMGSGFLLHRAFKKYGIENFKKEILEFYNSRIELLEAERNIVNMFEIKNPMCYNLAIGGKGQSWFPTKEEYDIIHKKAWQTRKKNENWKEAFISYNNPEFIGLCKERYEENKEEFVKWCINTNVPDVVIERLFNKKAHQRKVISYYIDSGILPKPLFTEKIRYENGYKVKTFFKKENILNVLFIEGSDTKKHINKLSEIIKFIKDENCTDSQVQNFKKYNFVKTDIEFFKKIGCIKEIGKKTIQSGYICSPTGIRTEFSFTVNINYVLLDKEMNKYEFDDNGKLIQTSRFFL